MSDDVGAAVNEWISVIRRACLGATVKLVAFAVASYANPDGTKVFPGIARLAVECEIGYSTAKRAVRALREAGLIELVRRGNRRAGLADEYRLIFAVDVLERITVITPEQERKFIEAIREDDRATSARRYSARVHGSPANREPVFTGQTGALSRVTSEPPPSIYTHPLNQPPYQSADLRTDLTVPGMIENPNLISAELDSPRHAPRARRSTRAEQTIAESQARIAAQRAAHRAQDDAAGAGGTSPDDD